MKDLTPERIKKWCRITTDKKEIFLNVFAEPDATELNNVKVAMRESRLELKYRTFKETDEEIAQTFIYEWAFYVKALNHMSELKSSVPRRHYTSNSYLSSFGIIGANGNVELGSLRFENNFLGEKLRQGPMRYSQTDLFMSGDRNTYMDHHELLFSEFESKFMQIFREKENLIIKKDNSRGTGTPIGQAIREQQGILKIIDSLYVRIIISIFILLTESKFFLRGVENHAKLSERLNNISVIASILTVNIRKKWYWVHADSSGEISLLHRGIIRLPEFGNSMFFSVSRVWGILFPDTEISNALYNKDKENFKRNEVVSISHLNNMLRFEPFRGSAMIGAKNNLILNSHSSEMELFYPHAKKLAFHPEFILR